MSAAMMFLIVFCAVWLAVAGTTIIHVMRGSGARRDISLVARAGLLIWSTAVIAAMLAEVRHWPAHEIGRMHAVEIAGKLAGFALLLAGVAPVSARQTRRSSGSEAGLTV
jgi:hypothetical protein